MMSVRTNLKTPTNYFLRKLKNQVKYSSRQVSVVDLVRGVKTTHFHFVALNFKVRVNGQQVLLALLFPK